MRYRVNIYWLDLICRQQHSAGRVFSSRTSVTPPSSDCSIHPLSDDETVRYIADGEFSASLVDSVKHCCHFLESVGYH